MCKKRVLKRSVVMLLAVVVLVISPMTVTVEAACRHLSSYVVNEEKSYSEAGPKTHLYEIKEIRECLVCGGTFSQRTVQLEEHVDTGNGKCNCGYQLWWIPPSTWSLR